MTDESYQKLVERVPGIIQELKDFQRILKDGYECYKLPISCRHKIRDDMYCQDIADHFIQECQRSGLPANKYVFFDAEKYLRNRSGEIGFMKEKVFTLENYPNINPWGHHYICATEGLVIEPLIGRPISLDSISLELFGEQVPIHKLDDGKTYTFWDVVKTLDERGYLQND